MKRKIKKDIKIMTNFTFQGKTITIYDDIGWLKVLLNDYPNVYIVYNKWLNKHCTFAPIGSTLIVRSFLQDQGYRVDNSFTKPNDYRRVLELYNHVLCSR